MSFRARLARWGKKVRSKGARRLWLLTLIGLLLGRLTLLTYWAWDNLNYPPTRRILVLMWGLALIAIAILLRFLRHTFDTPVDRAGSK